MSGAPARADLSVYIVAAVVFTVASVAWAGAVLLKLQPMYAKLFQDFGSALPAPTELCLAPWFPILAALPALTAASTLLRPVPRDARALLLIAATVLAIAQPVVFFFAMYLPIYSTATSVK